ncbi:MAG TPA: hypothetical protein VMD07_08275 [Candidatus Acidoferrales bacterium]|nr:hypothetical protein [Candidatus Acidoferrales bacterium]
MEDKVAAIYELREAAEQHARIEANVGERPKGTDRDRLLDARIELEQKTQRAIESCVYCGRDHADDEDECNGGTSKGKVIPVDFHHRSKAGEEEPPTA